MANVTLKLSTSLSFGETCDKINQLVTQLDFHVQ